MAATINIKKRGLIGTIIFHVLVLLIFIFSGFSIPLPLPEEEGLLINFGTSDDGLGSIEPESVKENLPIDNTIHETEDTEQQVADVAVEDVMTEDESDVAVETSEVVAEDVPDKVPEEVEEVEVVRQSNPALEYRPNSDVSNTSTGEGETTGSGNQGKEFGDPSSGNRDGGPSGSNRGVSFSLSGRKTAGLPKPEYTAQDEGKVVVTIKVNREGKVTGAIPGARGTTTHNHDLWKAAENAALKTKFDKKPDAPAYQVGTITYNFILN